MPVPLSRLASEVALLAIDTGAQAALFGAWLSTAAVSSVLPGAAPPGGQAAAAAALYEALLDPLPAEAVGVPAVLFALTAAVAEVREREGGEEGEVREREAGEEGER